MGCEKSTPHMLALLKRCAAVSAVKQIHSQMLVLNLQHLQNHLLSKLVDLRDLAYSSLVFRHIPAPNDYAFNVMIRALATTWNDHPLALLFYLRMLAAGERPNNFTYPFVFIACASLGRPDCGRAAHSSVFRSGLHRDLHTQNSLITMYARWGQPRCARKVFDEIPERDVVSWNSMISGYARMGLAWEAVDVFGRMREDGFVPDETTLASTLAACGDLGDLRLGRSLEEFVKEKGMRLTTYIGSALIDMYGKCGDLESARKVFDSMPERERVVWNAMITGYSQNGNAEEAIKLFQTMKDSGIEPDKITMVGVLSASASVGALHIGKWIDLWASDKGLLTDVYIGTGLVDMYGKCGKLDRATDIFQAMPFKNKITWNAMICALAFHGRASEAMALFYDMKDGGSINPDEVTFIGVLSACVHAGCVDEGCKLFDSMKNEFRIIPQVEHYSCMVDLLARSGRVDEAWSFIKRMPGQADAVMLGALLGACRNHKNAEVGESVSKYLLSLEPSNSGNYVIASKMYAGLNRWDESAEMRGIMRERGIPKTPGSSWIEILSQLHEFRSGDGSHLASAEISQMMDLLNDGLKREGYKPDASLL